MLEISIKMEVILKTALAEIYPAYALNINVNFSSFDYINLSYSANEGLGTGRLLTLEIVT